MLSARASRVCGCWATASCHKEAVLRALVLFSTRWHRLEIVPKTTLPARMYTWWTCCCCFFLIREYCCFSALMSVVMRSIIMLLKAAWYSLRQELMAPGLSSAMLLDRRLCSSFGSALQGRGREHGVMGEKGINEHGGGGGGGHYAPGFEPSINQSVCYNLSDRCFPLALKISLHFLISLTVDPKQAGWVHCWIFITTLFIT